MANRTYLISLNSDIPTDDYNPDQAILAAGSYMIPVFWYSLVDVNNIKNKKAESDDGTTATYPMFIIPTSQAIERAKAKEKQIFSVISKRFVPSFDDWLKLLHSIETKYVHIETLELWMMDEAGVFENEIKNCMAAFNSDAAGMLRRLFGKSHSKDWLSLLKQADIDPNNIESTTDKFKLHGYQWVRDVPWKEDC
jgi:hypothetical protein